jgi:putative SOS response-associated peptidase YedK
MAIKIRELRSNFHPKLVQEMYVACLWSYWQEGNEELDSFAAITDEPPSEVAAAGHDRRIILLKQENIDAWLIQTRRTLMRCTRFSKIEPARTTDTDSPPLLNENTASNLLSPRARTVVFDASLVL